MDEQKKYEVTKKLVEGKGNKNAAASHEKQPAHSRVFKHESANKKSSKK